MSIKSIFNLYSIIILCVIISAISIFAYVRYQDSKNQAAEIKYNPLSESEKALVNKNIKDAIAEQKQKRLSEAQKQKEDNDKHASVDETTVGKTEFNPDNAKAEYVIKRPGFIEDQSNEISVKKSRQEEGKPDIDVRSAGKIPEGLQFDPRDHTSLVPNINLPGREINIGSKEELIELIAEWENSDDPTKKAMSKSLKEQVDKLGDNVNMKIVIATD